MATDRLRQACSRGCGCEALHERVSNQLSNNRGEYPDTSADVGRQYEQAAWALAQGDGPTTWLRDELANPCS